MGVHSIMKIGIVVATDPNGLIGLNGDIPWFYKGDLKLFKEQTEGGVVVMGRKTWESLPYKPLKKRLNIVVTQSEGEYEGAIRAVSVRHALDYCRANAHPDVWLIGGSGVYAEGAKYATHIYETRVPDAVEVKPEDHPVYAPSWGVEDSGWDCKITPHPYAEGCVTHTYTRT